MGNRSRAVCRQLLFCFSLCALAPSTSLRAGSVDVSLRHEIDHATAQGLAYLASTQKADGSWSDYPGVTGLVITAFLRAPESIRKQYGKNVSAGLRFIGANVRADGGIYPEAEPQLRAYNTSICIMALVAADDPSFGETITKARQFLVSLQADEDDGVTPDSSTYGGIGYNKEERSDISNMQFALEALRASEKYAPNPDDMAGVKLDDDTAKVAHAHTELYWNKAILFLQRSQNLKKYNSYAWSKNDGGFVYYPGASKAGGTTSYGSMTYAGMKSFIHAGLTRSDERVQAAYNWIRANYTVDKNPEMDRQGLFYYYHTMAKALAMYGDDVVVDTVGAAHHWREDLTNKLLTIQNADGSWVNDNGRWWENNPDLVTAYCLMTLEEVGKE